MSTRRSTRSSTGKRPSSPVRSANEDVRKRRKKKKSENREKDSDATHTSVGIREDTHSEGVHEVHADVQNLKSPPEGASCEVSVSMSSPSHDSRNEEDHFYTYITVHVCFRCASFQT